MSIETETTFPDVASFMEATEPEAPEVEDGEEAEEFEDTDEADPAELEDEDFDPEEDSEDFDDDEEPESEPEPAVAAPQYLGADERAVFEQLPASAKKMFVEVDSRREAFITKKSQELSAVRQAFEQRMEGLSGFISETEQQLQAYDEIDWVAAGQQYSAEEILQAQAHRDQLRKQVETARYTAAQAEQMQHQMHTRQGFADLQEMAKTDNAAAALVDPARGQERIGKLRQYLVAQGVPEQEMAWANANDLKIAYKAMLYDQGVAKAESAKPKAAKKQVRSAPGGSRSTSATKRMKQLQDKPSLTVAEGAELMRIQRGRKRKAG